MESFLPFGPEPTELEKRKSMTHSKVLQKLEAHATHEANNRINPNPYRNRGFNLIDHTVKIIELSWGHANNLLH